MIPASTAPTQPQAHMPPMQNNTATASEKKIDNSALQAVAALPDTIDSYDSLEQTMKACHRLRCDMVQRSLNGEFNLSDEAKALAQVIDKVTNGQFENDKAGLRGALLNNAQQLALADNTDVKGLVTELYRDALFFGGIASQDGSSGETACNQFTHELLDKQGIDYKQDIADSVKSFVDMAKSKGVDFTVSQKAIKLLSNDSDGTIKPHHPSYGLSHQAACDGLRHSQFAKTFVDTAAILTSGPFGDESGNSANIGVVNLSTVDRNEFTIAAVAGRHVKTVQSKEFVDSNVSSTGQAIAKDIAADLKELYSRDRSAAQFRQVGSGLQIKGSDDRPLQLTAAYKTTKQAMTEDIRAHRDKIINLVLQAAQDKGYPLSEVVNGGEEIHRGDMLSIFDTHTDLEVRIASSDTDGKNKGWDKASGVAYLDQLLEVGVGGAASEGKINMIGGDSLSDTPMAKACAQLEASVTQNSEKTTSASNATISVIVAAPEYASRERLINEAKGHSDTVVVQSAYTYAAMVGEIASSARTPSGNNSNVFG